MPTTRGESKGEHRTRSEVIGQWVEEQADAVVGPRARPLDVFLLAVIAVCLIVAGSSQPVPVAVGIAALVLLAVRVIR